MRASTPTRVFSRAIPARGSVAIKGHSVIGDSMGDRVRLRVRRWVGFAVLLSLFASGGALAAWEWNFQPPATPIAAAIIDLHSLIFWICVVIFIGVFGTMFWSLYHHRKSIGHQAVQFHENTTVEIIWTVIPFLILLFMAYPATKTILAAHDTTAADLTIKVTGYQWKWGYDYVQDGFGYYSMLATPLAQIEGRDKKNGDGQRRHPRVVGTCIRRQAGRDSRLRP